MIIAKLDFVRGVGQEGEAVSFRGVLPLLGWRDCRVWGGMAPRGLSGLWLLDRDHHAHHYIIY